MIESAPPPYELTGRAEDGVVISENDLRRLAERIAGVPGIVGVALGGSRARGEHQPDSDVDLGLYYRPPLDLEGLRSLAREVAGPAAQLTAPGDWGPWVDGGGWLSIQGLPVDWLYRDLDRVRRAWADAREGRYAFHAQVGHPLGVPDFAYAGELALGVVLADPAGELAGLQADTRIYPAALGAALVAGLDEASFLLSVLAKAAARGDTGYVAGCLFRVVLLCAHALHGHAGRWLTNEKGAIVATGKLPGAPPDFAARAHGVLAHLGTQPVELDAAVRAGRALLEDTRDACSAVMLASRELGSRRG